jgi:tetratricopeptide (TPR) repeat protein
VLQNSFVNWDENVLVGNAGYRGFGWAQINWMFAAFHFGQYQPVAWASLAFDEMLWWTDPFGYHWTNLFLHVVNALLFYYVSLELLSCSKVGGRSRQRKWLSVAAVAAALAFAIHPLRAEMIAWASARSELVAAAFFLVSLLGYIKANASSGAHHNSKRWTIISIGAYLLSLLASPIGLLLPFILLTLDGYPLRRLAGPQNLHGTKVAHLLWQKTPYLALSSLFLAIALAANFHPAGPSTYKDNSLTWLLYQFAAPSFYLGKMIFPVGLSPAYELGGWSLSIYIAISAILCAGVVMVRKRFTALAAAWICYLVLILPLFRSEFPAQQILADRHTYLAGCTWALIICGFIHEWLHNNETRRYPSLALPVVGFATIIFVTLGYFTGRQIRAWKNSERLWLHAVEASPSSAAYFNLATVAEAQGKYDDAIASYRQAVALNPQRWQAHEAAARLLEKQEKIREAVEHYRLFVELNPQAVDAREHLAGNLLNLGEFGEAVQQFRKLLELAPERNEARIKLGTILALSGRLNEAVEVLSAAVKVDPEDGRVLVKLGQVTAAQGRLSEAAGYFREAVRLQSEDAEAQENLGRALLDLGKKEEASLHLREAVRILRSSPVPKSTVLAPGRGN